MNKMMNNMTSRQTGLSLVELMVAVLISLVLLLGVMQVFISSKRTYTSVEGVSRIQENGRFAVDSIARIVRMGGYQGCTNVNQVTPNIISSALPANYLSTLQSVVSGFDDATGSEGTPSYNAKSGSDIITIHSASSSTVELDGNLAAVNANIQIDGNPDNFQAGDILFITDCKNADVFTATSVSNGAGKVTIAHANNMNTTNRLSTPYGDDAMVMRLQSTSYFVRDTNQSNSVGAPIFGLFQRNELTGAETIIADGVEDMQILYGVDSGTDKMADEYFTADNVTNWERVVSVRISLLLDSVENVNNEPQTYQFMGNVINNPGDLKLRREFTSTIGIRNRSL